MPTKRRKRTPRRRANIGELSPDLRYQLLTGFPLFGEWSRVEELAAAWELHGEALTAALAEAHPGHRPYGWWRFEYKQERPVAAWAMPSIVERCRAEALGFLHTDLLGGMAPDGRLWAMQEPEPDYLKRRRLLSPAETAALRKRSADDAGSDPATKYARDVLAGNILAGRPVRLACERHLRDLQEGPARGLMWDVAAVRRIIDFISAASLPSENRPFIPEPSQAFIVGSLFGWKKANGLRRFVTAYIEQGKGGGKTPLAAVVGLYGLVADEQQSPEIYIAATQENQATICFRDGKRIVANTPDLKKRLDVSMKMISHVARQGFMRPVTSEHRGLSGPRPSIAIVDEIHEHPSAIVIDKLRAGFKGRSQPLMFEITNSGFDRATVCWQHHEYSQKVLRAANPIDASFDDTWFAYIASLDPCQLHADEGHWQPIDGCKDCDDWRDPATWIKANPCLGKIIQHDYLERQVKGAEGRPSEEGIVKRLNFSLWTSGETNWLPAPLWARGNRKVDLPTLRHAECYGGLDIASKIDVAALVLSFGNRPEPGSYSFLSRFWIPKATAEERQQADNIPWLHWAAEGFVILTPGDVIHLDLIEQEVKDLAEAYTLKALRYDPWNAHQMAVHLQETGIEMVEFPQTLRNFNEPTKEFEKLLKEGKIVHGGHPVLDWMAGNVCVYADANGNIRPLKPAPQSPRKVDGLIGAVMALAGAMLAGDDNWYTPNVMRN